MVKPAGPKEEEIMDQYGISKEEYPYVSPCGKELNFIRPAATPIVFHTLDHNNNTLVYAGSRTQEFQMSALAMSERTGRLYHRCEHLEKASAKAQNQNQSGAIDNLAHSSYALIRSAVVVSFSDHIVPMEEEEILARDNSLTLQNYSGLAYVNNDNHEELPHPIPWLPREAEPGSWAMPSSEDAPEG